MANGLQPPPGQEIVSVRLINPVNFGPSIIKRFMAPAVPGLDTFESVPSFSFLIDHPSGRRLVWDLGIRKDYQNHAPKIANYIPTTNYNIRVSKNVVDTLEESGVPANGVEAVIWSHWHWDHIGDPSTFPLSTHLIVGRGFKTAMLPGAPTNPDSPILESDYAGRELLEIDFDGPNTLQIGRFPAFDYFGDGSFYLLDSPGHAVGHMSGLARTTTDPDTFILLGGDICHYAGVFRPSKHLPAPNAVNPYPGKSHTGESLCLGATFEKLQRSRGREATDSIYDPTFGDDIPLAIHTIKKLQELDCDDNIFTIIAHDASVRDTVDHYPLSLNSWYEKGWGKRCRWAFFRDFERALTKVEEAK